MGWLSDRRAVRRYREGTITLNQMLNALGLPAVTADDLPQVSDKSRIYFQNVAPLRPVVNTGDMWVNPDKHNEMKVWDGTDWEKVGDRGPGMWMGADGDVAVVGSLTATNTAVSPTEPDKGDPRQPWAIVADLYEAVEGLLLDPREVAPGSEHCIDEYNAGLRNALGILREQCEALGGTIDRPEPGEEPVPGSPDMEAVREELRKAGQHMLDQMRPIFAAAQAAGFVQPKVKVKVPHISEEELQRISDRVAETVAPLLAAVAASKVKAPKRPHREG